MNGVRSLGSVLAVAVRHTSWGEVCSGGKAFGGETFASDIALRSVSNAVGHASLTKLCSPWSSFRRRLHSRRGVAGLSSRRRTALARRHSLLRIFGGGAPRLAGGVNPSARGGRAVVLEDLGVSADMRLRLAFEVEHRAYYDRLCAGAYRSALNSSSVPLETSDSRRLCTSLVAQTAYRATGAIRYRHIASRKSGGVRRRRRVGSRSSLRR